MGRVTFRCALPVVAAALLASSAFAADSHVIPSKLRAKFSSKKITVKGKVAAVGQWPLTLRVMLIGPQEEVIASASDTLRAGDGEGTFQIELTPARGQRFDRTSLANARLRYGLRKGKTEYGDQTVLLADICPNLTAKKHKWWPW